MTVKCRWCGADMRIRRVDDPTDIMNSSPLAIVFSCDAAGCGRCDKISYSKLDYKIISDTEIIKHEDDIETSLCLSA